MEKDKISVIVPAYNVADTIGKCLKSILGGGYSNVEIVVVNDGSTDKTEKIVRAFQEIDNRVILINQENHGVGYAKSTGVRASRGDFIAFCDADDWYDDNFLCEHHRHIIQYQADISQCRTQQTEAPDFGNSDDIEIIEDDLVRKYLQYQSVNVSLCDKLYRRELFESEEIENDFRYSEDLYMNYVAAKKCSKIVKFNTTKYNWYCNHSSLSRSKFNPVKLECDFLSWGRIIDDCRVNYPELEEVARLSSELWIAGTYRTMVHSHYHNKKLEKKIAVYIRQDGYKKTLAAEKNRANKRFIRLALISLPLARYIWYALTGVKKIAKIVIQR